MPKAFQKDPLIASRKIAGETILVPIRRDVVDLQCIYTLNRVGARIWDLLDGRNNVEDIAETITSEFEVDRPQAEADVEEFLGQLEEVGAIKVSIPSKEGGAE